MKIGNTWCLVFYRGHPDLLGRPAQQTPDITITPPTEERPHLMDVGEPGLGTSAIDELFEATSEESGTSLQLVVDEPMPEASHTSKRVREPEGSEQPDKKNTEKKRKKHIQQTKIKDIVEELKCSNFTNIREVLGMLPIWRLSVPEAQW